MALSIPLVASWSERTIGELTYTNILIQLKDPSDITTSSALLVDLKDASEGVDVISTQDNI